MLTKIIVNNFKRLEDVEIELGNPVVFIGPNNSGKTSALQAMALWEIGIKRWLEKRKGLTASSQRPGVTINRRDLISAPVPNSRLLWKNLHVRDTKVVDGKQSTENVRIDITVEGASDGKTWQCGLEYDYANEESFYCRPLRIENGKNPARMPIPTEAGDVKIAFLPPMSGLASNEIRLEPGAISVRIGEGRTAEVLRNLCYNIHDKHDEWNKLKHSINSLFGVDINTPEYISERGEIDMTYNELGIKLDLSSSGRGLQQTLLLLAYMYANPGSLLLLDEPDAHLEILRQRQIYQILSNVASETGSQIIAASHSEILLNEAANRDTVIAFVGSRPHRIDDRGSQVLKSLKDIGYEHYYQAEHTGWVLYLEGSTDLAILLEFAKCISNHEAIKALERPFVCYVGNNQKEVKRHYYGLKEAVPSLKGIAIFDRLEKGIDHDLGADGYQWEKREIENYLCFPEALMSYVENETGTGCFGPLFDDAKIPAFKQAMQDTITELEKALSSLDKGSPWGDDLKVSDEFLTPLFQKFFKKINMPNTMLKTNFHRLAKYVPIEKIDGEVNRMLARIVRISKI